MQFRHPIFFILLLAVPLLFLGTRRSKQPTLLLSTSAFFPESFSLRIAFSRILPWLRAAVLVLFVMALARPQKVASEREHLTEGIDIVIALDISGSMLAEDFKPENRMTVAKQEAIKFIEGRKNDQIGMVVFAKKAYTQCPLTTDYDVLIRLLQEVQPGMIADGTAIGMGLATAVNRLRDSPSKSKVIILITDGANNAGNIDPITAAELAKSFKIRTHTIAVGKGGLVPFPVNDPLFGKRYVQANIEIDEMTMKRIADITGGKFFRARDPEALENIYKQIDQLEKTEMKVKEYQSFDELFYYFLIPALLLLLIEILLSQTFFAKVP